MAQARANCTCKECGAEFIRKKTCRNRAEAESWEKWAEDNFDLCGECYKKACDEHDLEQPLTLHIRIELFRPTEPVLLAFSGCSKKYKDKIKELGYYWREDVSGVFGGLNMHPDFCWQKNIKLDELDAEVKRASEICDGDEFIVKNDITDVDLAAYRMIMKKREEEAAQLKEALAAVEKPTRPACMPQEGMWNGKIYGSEKSGFSVYVNSIKINITTEEKEQIEKYSEAMDTYHAKVKEIKAGHKA